ncbi:MAG: thiamine pyrophosphate-dependent enzyme [Microgenomates group bacterium]
MATVQDFTGYKPTWCPGCGNWGIGMGIKMALSELGHSPSSTMISFGIGCSGNMNDFLNAYAMHGLHGRAIATAIGMKLANHTMPVLAVVGDGDCYGEGGNHFLHACRGNHDVKVIIHDNNVYGLTTGQVSPMAEKGQKSKSTPQGIIETPLDPLALAITQGASFVAQTFAGDTKHMVETIKLALQHTGFSVVNVLQPCVTFNKKNTYQYYMQHIYKLDASHDKSDKMKALQVAFGVQEERFALGVLYETDREAYHTIAVQNKDIPVLNQPPFSGIGTLAEEFI